ncbi:MAG: hypothetical protein M5U28_41940 [Sandaracinaceae bacterium]|nr:hypothetical protein [Sandaracinaceae bacterium]
MTSRSGILLTCSAAALGVATAVAGFCSVGFFIGIAPGRPPLDRSSG